MAYGKRRQKGYGPRYRTKRQKGYGPSIREKRQRGYGPSIREKRQRGYGQTGKGPRWEKFKARLRRGWQWAKPKLYDAGRKAVPAVQKLILDTPRNRRKEALKSIGKQFGRDLLSNLKR